MKISISGFIKSQIQRARSFVNAVIKDYFSTYQPVNELEYE